MSTIIEKKMCKQCGKSGLMEMGGFQKKPCPYCKGTGYIDMAKEDFEFLHLKTTDSYKTAIDKIKAVDKNISTEKAEEIFKNELYNLRDEDKPKRGRPTKEKK
jgi:hypothetical protein